MSATIATLAARANRVWGDLAAGKDTKGLEPEATTQLRALVAEAAATGGSVKWVDKHEKGKASLTLHYTGKDFEHISTTQGKAGDTIPGRTLIDSMDKMAFAVLVRSAKRAREQKPYDPYADLMDHAQRHGFTLAWEGTGIVEPPYVIGTEHKHPEQRAVYKVLLTMERPDLTWPFVEWGPVEELEEIVLRIVRRALAPLWGLSGLATLAAPKRAAVEVVKDVPRETRKAAE